MKVAMPLAKNVLAPLGLIRWNTKKNERRWN